MKLVMPWLLLGFAIPENSEGVSIEYIAIFVAALFPGALIAFNNEMLQNMPYISQLRIYCAGIWHNAAFCGACRVLLFLLPCLLYPFYARLEHPMVLNVNAKSALSHFLSPGDLILSLDGSPICNHHEWVEKIASKGGHKDEHQNFNGSIVSWPADSRRGYCVPGSWIRKSVNIQAAHNQSVCSEKLMAFMSETCFNARFSDLNGHEDMFHEIECAYCLPSREVFKREKCGRGWHTSGGSWNNHSCLQDMDCLSPLHSSSVTWTEISYSTPQSSDCLPHDGNSSSYSQSTQIDIANCGGTFIFIGDLISEANSILLSSYRPRSGFSLGVHLPVILEKLLSCIFHVSAALALLNSLPVYFLDGESILKVLIFCVNWLGIQKHLILRSCLLMGFSLSFVAMIRQMLSFLHFQ